jgi:hypothetical protein
MQLSGNTRSLRSSGCGRQLPFRWVFLAWVVAPWLRDQLGGDDPFAQALLICITAGLIWQFVLVLVLIRRELGGTPMVARARRPVAAGTPRS